MRFLRGVFWLLVAVVVLTAAVYLTANSPAGDQLTSPLDEHDQEVHRLAFEPKRTATAT